MAPESWKLDLPLCGTNEQRAEQHGAPFSMVRVTSDSYPVYNADPAVQRF
jgi:hypothetical protein